MAVERSTRILAAMVVERGGLAGEKGGQVLSVHGGGEGGQGRSLPPMVVEKGGRQVQTAQGGGGGGHVPGHPPWWWRRSDNHGGGDPLPYA